MNDLLPKAGWHTALLLLLLMLLLLLLVVLLLELLLLLVLVLLLHGGLELGVLERYHACCLRRLRVRVGEWLLSVGC